MLLLGFVVSGLVSGALAGINSLGLILLWRTTRLVNLAQPAMGLVGGVLTGLLVQAAHWSFWWAAPVGLLVGSLLGFGTDRLVFRRMREAPRAVMLVATVGLAGLFGAIQAGLPFIFTGRTLPTYTIKLGVVLDVGPVRLLGPDLLVLIIFPITLAGLAFFLYRTRFGLAALALGQDSERARALGVSASAVRAVVWTVAGILATISGILSIPVLGFNLAGGLGPIVLLLALAPAVFAGLRSLLGAAVAALSIGVAYSLVHHYVPRAGIAEVVFAGAMLLAIALQGRRIGRAETAARASSWEAAATIRPLPWSVTSSPVFRLGAAAFVTIAVAAGLLIPLFLSSGDRVLYSATIALAVGALSVAVAWMFAGEIVLGNWGMAGLGFALALITPGPLVFRGIVAGAGAGLLGGVLGFATRRRSNLSFAVLGLVVAGAAPVALLFLSDRKLPGDPSPALVGAVGAVIVVIAAVIISHLRSTAMGARMIAARDDPDRAPWLGADPVRSRVIALWISGALAGIAGTLYAASFGSAGLAPGAFDPGRSLDVLSMAVIGGMGSPAGAVAGAMAVQAGRFVLPSPWNELASGTGVLLVVIFRPAGLSHTIRWARDRAVALIVRRPPAPAPAEEAVA